MGRSDKCQIGESNQSAGGKPLSIPIGEYEIRPRKDEADDPGRRNITKRCAGLSSHIVFYGKFLDAVLSQTGFDVLQCFTANCLYGGRNRLHAAV